MLKWDSAYEGNQLLLLKLSDAEMLDKMSSLDDPLFCSHPSFLNVFELYVVSDGAHGSEFGGARFLLLIRFHELFWLIIGVGYPCIVGLF